MDASGRSARRPRSRRLVRIAWPNEPQPRHPPCARGPRRSHPSGSARFRAGPRHARLHGATDLGVAAGLSDDGGVVCGHASTGDPGASSAWAGRPDLLVGTRGPRGRHGALEARCEMDISCALAFQLRSLGPPAGIFVGTLLGHAGLAISPVAGSARLTWAERSRLEQVEEKDQQGKRECGR
jgi:hypothetical protein